MKTYRLKGEIKIKTHEKKVEEFYATGLNEKDFKKLKENNGRFLSFGYWENNTKTYSEAAKNLLNFFIKNSKIKKTDKILNVACGYGAETFEYYKKFKSKTIYGVDITKLHVIYANYKARKLGLDKKIKFYHGDACVLDFPKNTFSHLFGIEGIANFNTRQKFFKAAHKILQKNGELLLTDIILGKKFNKRKPLHKLLVGFAAKTWVIPKENWTNEEDYKKQLEKAGFKIIFLKKIGKKVFPGYAHYHCQKKPRKEVTKERGFFTSIGLTIISWVLGYLYKKGWIEYIYVKAKKV